MKYHLVETSLTGEARIYRGKLIVGMLKNTFVNQDAYGEFLGTMLRFRKKKFLSKKVSVLDIEGKKEVGEILFADWGRKVTVQYNNKMYLGELSGKSGQWCMEDKEEDIVFESPSVSVKKGMFEQNYMNPAIVLATVYIRAYYKVNRMIAVGLGIITAVILIISSINLFSS